MSADHARFLLALAGRVAAPFIAEGAAAALVVGSAASGEADQWSDLDLILFYRSWPGAARLAAAREQLSGTGTVSLGGDPEAGMVMEQVSIAGVACQFVHQTVEAWRDHCAVVLRDLDPVSPVQKALSGLHAGVILHGEELVVSLRAEAPYPDALRPRMVEHHLDVFPLWFLRDALVRRDAELWQRMELAGGLQRVLAVLSGVNAVFFSAFQLKHTARLAASFRVAPPRLAARIEEALEAPMVDAIDELERLVDEMLAIVEQELPEVNVDGLRRTIGQRQQPWSVPSTPG